MENTTPPNRNVSIRPFRYTLPPVHLRPTPSRLDLSFKRTQSRSPNRRPYTPPEKQQCYPIVANATITKKAQALTDGENFLLYNKGPQLHSNLQITVFKRVHQWRDQIAREEDESVNYVLPNRSLINLAASLPHNMQSVVAACHPVPPLVQVYAEDIAYIVQKTRKELAEEADKAESTAAQTIQGAVESKVKNGVTGSTHVWYKDDSTAPNGVRSAMEAVRHGAQFDIWGDQKDRLHSLILNTSQFWEPLKRGYIAKNPIYEVGGELEDIKLSVPLPPLTAQIYMTAEDVKAMAPEDKEEDNVAALAEHPFVQRSKEDQKKGPKWS